MKYRPEDEAALITELHDPKIKDNLLAFVMFAYPWGKPGTWLEAHKGPYAWHIEDLEEMTQHIKDNTARMAAGQPPKLFKKATSSGRGTGKSAEAAWLTDWMLTTRIGSTTIISANTEPQLKSRTFAEITKWTNVLINSHWFETTVLSVRPAPWFGAMVRDQLQIDTGYYYAQGQLWSEENPDAFAGVHNPFGVLLQFDEAAGIPSTIFTVSAGFFTEATKDRYWRIASNPRRNSGGFYDAFHDTDTTWKLRVIDSRTVEGQDPEFADGLIKKYGIDSDQVRIEVLGLFPKQGDRQFIASSTVRESQDRELTRDDGAALIMGVDIARYGNDETVFRFRRGRDARSIPAIRLKHRDNMQVVKALAEAIDLHKPDAVNIDAGNGTGVIDRIRELGYRVNEIWFGSSSSQPEWANKRTQMWADLRDWLPGGCIDRDPRLFTDLTVPEYDFFGKAKDQMMLESKEHMKGRGFESPNDGDALALTFAVRVSRKDTKTSKAASRGRMAQDVDYQLFS